MLARGRLPDREVDQRREVVFVTGANPMCGGGGLESYVRAHALAAHAAGFVARVFCVGPRRQVTAQAFGTVDQVRVPRHTIRGVLAGLYTPLVVRALCARVARSDVVAPVLVHAFGAYGAVGASFCAELERIGIDSVQVTSAYATIEDEHRAFFAGLRREHGAGNAIRYLVRYGWARAIGTRSERRGYEASRLVVVNYESVRELLRAQFGASWEIRLLPYASDAAFVWPADAALGSGPGPGPEPVVGLGDRDAPLIVCVSRHDARKGVDVLLRALGLLRAAGVPFRACLLGRGELIGAHRRLAARLGLERCVAITGQVPDVRPYLRCADVYVLPSLSESSGSVSLLEACQAGAAIVASSCDGIPEDVTDGDSGLLVAPGDERALMSAIARLLGDQTLRRRLGGRARELYESRFSAERLTAALAGLYAELGVAAGRPNASSVSTSS